jgi:hypothetical protein
VKAHCASPGDVGVRSDWQYADLRDGHTATPAQRQHGTAPASQALPVQRDRTPPRRSASLHARRSGHVRDLVSYLADEAYDARDSADTSRAEASARWQDQAYLRVIRSLPGTDAYIVSTGP